MPGKRQPTDVIKANGRKHLSRAEEAQRRAGEVNLSTAKTARPPSWLPEEPKELKKSFRALGRQLIEAKLFTELDRDTLGRYVVAQHQWELASKAAGEALEQGDQEKADGWSRIQDRYFKQARVSRATWFTDCASTWFTHFLLGHLPNDRYASWYRPAFPGQYARFGIAGKAG